MKTLVSWVLSNLGVVSVAGWRSKVDVVESQSQMAPEGPSGVCPPTSMKLFPKDRAAARRSGPGIVSVMYLSVRLRKFR